MTFFPEILQSDFNSENAASIVENMVRLAVQGAGAKSGSLFIRRGENLYPWYTVGLTPEYVEACGAVPVGEQCCGRAVYHKRPWIVSNMLTDPDWTHMRDEIVKTPIRAGFSVPVMDGEDCIASLACHFPVPHQPSAHAIQRNVTFATLIAFAFRRFPKELDRHSSRSAAAD